MKNGDNDLNILLAQQPLSFRAPTRGGMGTVYLAKDRLAGTEVALKRVTIEKQALRFASFQPAEDIRLALARKFRVLASLRHPCIISVLDYGFDEDNRPYLSIDYLPEGRPLVAFGDETSHPGR